jgi:hypothetical protein
MSSRDDERRVLDAIENQLRTEDPQLVGRFSAFGRVAPPITPVNGRDAAARHRKVASAEGNGTGVNKYMPAVLELVLAIIASTFVAVLIALAVWWMLTALSHLGNQACHEQAGRRYRTTSVRLIPLYSLRFRCGHVSA